jgi:hypothetical protein
LKEVRLQKKIGAFTKLLPNFFQHQKKFGCNKRARAWLHFWSQVGAWFFFFVAIELLSGPREAQL